MATHWTEKFFTETYSRLGLEDKLVFGRVEAELLKKELKLRKGMKVLDLCCGIGRHSVPLAELGLDVTGLDLTQAYLRKARARARKAGVEARFVRGDMRSLSYKKEFNAVFNLYTSFGFYDDEVNFKVLKGIARSLKSRGCFLMEIINRDWMLKNFNNWVVTEKEGELLIDRPEFDPMTSRVYTSWLLVSGSTVEDLGCFDLRVYSLHELVSMIERAGMKVAEVYGGLDFSPFEADSRWIVILAHKR